MNDCIFCKLVRKEIPSKIVYEDDTCVAFLDVMPRSKGMCLVVPKEHYTFFDEDFDTSSKTFDVALIVGEKIKKALDPLTVFFSIIQAQVPHFHIRVYPVYEDQIPLGENQPIETNEGELTELATKIKSVDVDWKPKKKEVVEVIKEVPVKKKEPEPEEKSEEEKSEKKKKRKKIKEEKDFWRKRDWEMA
jgi:histidine triad (HIT) family protein